GNFTQRLITAIPQPIGCTRQENVPAYGYIQDGGIPPSEVLRHRDIGPGIGHAEGSGGRSGAIFAVIAEEAAQEKIRGNVIHLHDAYIFQNQMFGIGAQFQKVGGRWNKDWVGIIHLKIVTAQMMLAQVEVHLSQVFIGVLSLRPTVKRKLIVGSVGKRNVIQNISSDRAYRNLRTADVGEISGALGRIWNK